MKIARAMAALVLVSCGGDGRVITEPEPDLYDVEDALAQIQTAEVLSNTGMQKLGYRPWDFPQFGTQACPFNAADQRFVCPAAVIGGLTLNRWYQLLDASGAAQSEWGSNVVAVRNVSDMKGTFATGSPFNPSFAVDRHEDAVLTGVREERQTLNGQATSAGVTFRMAQKLVLPKWDVETYPKSGSIVTIDLGDSGGGSLTVTLTFNGTSVVTLKMGSGAGAGCTFDLKAPQTPMVCP